jgi:hypothetical protein
MDKGNYLVIQKHLKYFVEIILKHFRLIELRRIEAAQAIVKVMAQNPNVSYLPSSSHGSNVLLNLPAAK